MLLLIMGSVGVATILLGQGLIPDREQRSIRSRLAAELRTPEENAPGRMKKLARMLKALSALSPLKFETFQKRLGRSLESGRVALSAVEFVALKQMVAIVAAVGSMALLGSGKGNPMFVGVAALTGFFLPDIWLHRRIEHRHRAVSRDLPDMVDLLSLCVGAGADFMAATTRVVREFRRGPLVEELSTMLQEIKLGKRRRDAIRAMASRVDTPDVNSFARTLVQADRMGTGIAEALRIQSEDSRSRRQQFMERLAQRAPMKMLLPLIFFIMPSVLIVVAGPVLLQFIQGDLLGKLKF